MSRLHVLSLAAMIAACSASEASSGIEPFPGARYACSGEDHMCVADQAWDAWLTDAPPDAVLDHYRRAPGATLEDDTVSWSDGERSVSALDPTVTTGYAEECGLRPEALAGTTMILFVRDLRACSAPGPCR